jgi:hypothetical protein
MKMDSLTKIEAPENGRFFNKIAGSSIPSVDLTKELIYKPKRY